ncbi:MAG: hypothetical protein GY856_00955 [bacterium]|nr:hypothetical protein [bacterium]
MNMPETSPTRSPSAGDLLAASLLAILLILPLTACNRSAAMPPQDAAASSYTERCGGEPESIMTRDLGGRTKIKVEHGRCRLEIEMEGDVDFLADESGIERMGRGASLEIEERIRRQRRRLEVVRGEDGRPEYAWFVDRRREEFDDEARAWLREILPQVFRITGIDADRRVERILARDGAEGVLHEIDLIPGDYVQRIYFQELLEQAVLSAAELERVIRLAGREIDSDYELAEILIGISHEDLDAQATRAAYVAAAREIDSDYELRRTLAALAEGHALDAQVLDTILEAAQSIDSDYELAELLSDFSEVYPQDQELPESFFRALDGLDSDYEHRRVLVAVLERSTLTPEMVVALLESSRSLGSDYELAEFLVKLVRAYPIDDALQPPFMETLETVGSEHERERVTAALERSTRR